MGVDHVALAARDRACTRSRPGGGGSGKGCWRRSIWLTVSNSERKDEAPASTSGRGLTCESGSKLRTRLVRSASLFVAQPTAGDLFIGAKDLFIAAMDGKGPSQAGSGASRGKSRQSGSKVRPFPLCTTEERL